MWGGVVDNKKNVFGIATFINNENGKCVWCLMLLFSKGNNGPYIHITKTCSIFKNLTPTFGSNF